MKSPALARTLATTALVFTALSLSACAGMSQREKSTAIGAAVGGVAGSVLTGGSTIGTVGGAVVGGAVGSELDKKK